MSKEIYRECRPKDFKYVFGQAKAVQQLQKFIEKRTLPHALLFTGPSGTGKNTLAYILREKLGCDLDMDYTEIDCTDTRGIDMVRGIKDQLGYYPKGKCRVYFIDEFHEVASKTVQAGFLKILEDPPETTYFFLATTEPNKLLATIRTRCTEIRLTSLSETAIEAIINQALAQKKRKIPITVQDKLVEAAEGSGRKALVLLHQILDLEDEQDQLEVIELPELKQAAFEIVKALVYTRADWPKMCEILKTTDLTNTESLRRFVLACAKTEALKAKGPSKRAILVIEAFKYNMFESGEAGFVAACAEVAFQ